MPTTDPSAQPEAGRVPLLLLLVVLLAVGAGVAVLFRFGAGPLLNPQACQAQVGEVTARVSTAQAENASLIAAVGVRRGLPARAVSIALATAFQESKLRNLDYGDRDSVGLFQQRPSQGWGTRRQLMDPVYATNAFYDALVKVEGYRDMRITEAAQRVQRSGFPEAYEEHAEGARALASALTGWSPATFTCVVAAVDVAGEQPAASGLTPRAERVRAKLLESFGHLAMGGFDPDGVDSGHMEGSAHYDGRAIDVFLRPADASNRRRGWAVAHYLVAHAERLKIGHVIFDQQIWSSGRSSEGWRDYRPTVPSGAGPETRAVLEHRDHVHVDVVGGG